LKFRLWLPGMNNPKKAKDIKTSKELQFMFRINIYFWEGT